jgi:hypothetical protein
VNVTPAIFAVPVRCEVLVLAATTTVTLPEPVRFDPLLTVNQVAFREADQPQPLPVVTLTVIDSPADGDVREVGAIVYVQSGSAAACVTVNEWPAIVSVALREVVAALAVALNVTAAVPVPSVPDVMVSQPAGLLALHSQPSAAVTVTEPPDAGAGSDALAAESVGVQVSVKENWFDGSLTAVPPGPMAATRASYCRPAARGVESRLR